MNGLPTYKPRPETTLVLLHDSATPPSQSHLEHFLACKGRSMGLLEIGYHYLILQDGKLVACRPHTVQGTHCAGANKYSIGVCLAGGIGPVRCEDCSGSGLELSPWTGEPTECHGCRGDTVQQGPCDNFKPAQKDTLRHLMGYLAGFYGPLPLQGHSELAQGRHSRQCPMIDMEGLRECVT